VNNNSKDPVIVPKLSVPVVVLACDFPVKGPEQGHQTALKRFIQEGYEIAVRWDDDLIPEQRCMEYLLHGFDLPFVNCVGGCYYRQGSQIYRGGPHSGFPPSDGNWNHIQYFLWQPIGESSVPGICPRSLYSGFAYQVKAMSDQGGFCTEYSKVGHRGETDATLRLGCCWIAPAAVALHKVSEGGVRSIPCVDKVRAADHALFVSRMKKLAISPGSRGWVI
jgi:hypothetical protein